MTTMTAPASEPSPSPSPTRVVVYCRVSSDEQADKGTIATQREVLERRIAQTPGIDVVGRFEDDGVSGTIPFADRPAGKQLVVAVESGAVDEVWVYKVDRLGRDAIDLMLLFRRLDPLSVKIISMQEGEQQGLPFDINAVVADYGRRTFLRLVADGVDRTARDGRYPGGVVAYGFKVEGKKPDARLVPDRDPVHQGLSPADIITRMYERVALDDWSCRMVADEFNALGLPTHSQLDGPGTRKRGTSGTWGEGRIRNMLVKPIFKGVQVFGQRSKKGPREIITAPVEPIVPEGLWQEAQEALARHRIAPKNTDRVYLLRGVMVCTFCGFNYVGSTTKGGTWYRCGGQRHGRGSTGQRCPGRGIKGDHIEPLVWQDVVRYLRDPGDLIDELDDHRERDRELLKRERDLQNIASRLGELDAERHGAQRLAIQGHMTEAELGTELDRIEADRAVLERHRASLAPPVDDEPIDLDLLGELHARLDEGLDEHQKQEVVRLLVGRISITTSIKEDGTKDANAMISYRFPVALSTRTSRGSSRR